MSRPDADEADYLARYRPDAFERPSLAVDVVLLRMRASELEVLLLQRSQHPFRGCWALPGGFVRIDESLDAAAARVLAEKAGLAQPEPWLEQLKAFGRPDRDPRMRVVTVAYFALVDAGRVEVVAPTRPHSAVWARVRVEDNADEPFHVMGPAGERLELGFDHAAILREAFRVLRDRIDGPVLGFQLLPPQFTLRELQAVHEAVLGRPLNKDSFRRKILASGLVAPTGEREDAVGHRPAERYRIVAGREIPGP